MATMVLAVPTRRTASILRLVLAQSHGKRWMTTTSTSTTNLLPPPAEESAMARLSNKNLARSLVLTQLMATPWLMRPSVAVLGFIAHSKLALFNPDRNPVLNWVLRKTIYDQFCAGVDKHEVRRSVAEYKKLGFQGVILTHAKEILLEDAGEKPAAAGGNVYDSAHYVMVETWKQHSLDTLRMLKAGDFLSLKLTGAGPIAVDALKAGKPMPSTVVAALDEICSETRKQGSRVWFDAEQQGLQPTIDEWAIDVMRKWNQGGQAVVYNTIQAYLKASKANAERHVRLAAEEGWAVGIKLVRGAYIENEVRSLIHDTKRDTDRCYDAIADMLVSQRLPEGVSPKVTKFPNAALMLATHNAESTAKACLAHQVRVGMGLPTCVVDCAQIAGMADELSCQLVQKYEQLSLAGPASGRVSSMKLLTWGSVGECLGYLHRRAIENQGAVERTHSMLEALKKEARRRMFGA